MFHQKPIYRVDCLKKGPGHFVDLKGVSLARMKGWCVYGGNVDTSMHNMLLNNYKVSLNIFRTFDETFFN